MVDVEDIKKEIIAFYRSLMGTALPSVVAVNKKVTKEGPKLNHAQQDNTTLAKRVSLRQRDH